MHVRGYIILLDLMTVLGMHYPSVMSAIGQHCIESEQTLVYSVVAAGCAGGALFTGLAGSIILEKYGWQSVFRFLGESHNLMN